MSGGMSVGWISFFRRRFLLDNENFLVNKPSYLIQNHTYKAN